MDFLDQEESYHEESHPSDYGYNGFEDWDDFHNYCDEFERGCDWE